MKKIIIASVLIVGLAAGFAYSHGNGRAGYGNNMMGSGYGMMGGGSNGMMGSGYGRMGGGSNGMMGNGYGMMGGYGGEGIYSDCPGVASSGQGGWNSETQQKFLEETVDLRKQMNDTRFNYMEAQRNPNTTREQLAEIEKEMIDLRTQLSAKAEQVQ